MEMPVAGSSSSACTQLADLHGTYLLGVPHVHKAEGGREGKRKVSRPRLCARVWRTSRQ